MPAPLNAESLPINLRLYNKFKTSTSAVIAERELEIFLEALHKRTEALLVTDELKNAYTNPSDLAMYIKFASDTLGMSLAELISMPEQDDWVYDATEGKPIFSSGSFVAGALKALGIFEDLDIHTQEFTVKDIYELDIFDVQFAEMPDRCLEADYSLNYCQLMGTFRLDLGPTYSSVKPYAKMNQSCPNALENSFRPEKC